MTKNTRENLTLTIGSIIVTIIVVLAVIFVCGISVPAGAEGYRPDSEEIYRLLQEDHEIWSSGLVKQIQKACNDYLGRKGYERIKEDGIFGPATGNAVELYQYYHKLEVDGICGQQTLGKMGIRDTGEHPRYVPDLLTAFDRTGNDLAAHVSKNAKNGEHYLEVYQITEEGWELIRLMPCCLGNRAKGTPSPYCNNTLSGKGNHSYIHNEADTWRGYYATRYTKTEKGVFFFHTVLAHKRHGKWSYDDNSCLGKELSHGCVRLSVEDAKWVAENFTPGTVVVFDARNWNLAERFGLNPEEFNHPDVYYDDSDGVG